MKKVSVCLIFVLSASLILFNQCRNATSAVVVDINNTPFEKLSDYHFFKGSMKALIPNEGVLPYNLITPLFSDYARKARFVWMPKGKAAAFQEREVLDFPVGAVLIKNFYYDNNAKDLSKGRRILETRLLVRKKEKWDALEYVWNDEQTEAFLNIVGDEKKVDWTDEHGVQMHTKYVIPNKNQCKGCHSVNANLMPIGPKIRNLNSSITYPEGQKNQLDKWTEVSYLKGYVKEHNLHNKLAQWDDPKSGTIEERAKAYLEMNCGHCHRREGPANTTGLFLMSYEKDPESWGILKSPVAAGRASGNNLYDIVPGNPDASIMPYRMNSTDPEIMMPELGRRLIHKEAVSLIREWIAEMK